MGMHPVGTIVQFILESEQSPFQHKELEQKRNDRLIFGQQRGGRRARYSRK